MPRERDRADSGEYTTEVSLAAVFGVIEESEWPVVTVTDVVDALDCSREIARQKLLRLSDQGRIDARKAGRQRLWWLPVHTELARDSPEQTLQWLSQEVDEAIIVGETVYEDGDQHPLSDAAEGEQ
jgi:predicted transcriptional regulator of viral defense system